MKAHFQTVVLMLFGLLLAGCASTGMIEHASPVAPGTEVSIDFALVETSSDVGGLDAEQHLLNGLIVSGLRGQDVFGEVGNDPAAAATNSGIKVQVVIKSIKTISHEEREWAGALAGRAHVLVAISVTDLGSGKVVQTFEAAGESSGGSDLAGTTDEAIQRAAEQIVAQLVRISRITGP